MLLTSTRPLRRRLVYLAALLMVVELGAGCSDPPSRPVIIPIIGDDYDRGGAWPSWSPDGQWILFWHRGGGYGPRGIYRIKTDGSERSLLIPGAPPDAPDWSPDGRYIVYARYDLHVYRMDMGSGEEVRLTSETSCYTDRNLAPAWSPDGTTLAFNSSACTSRGAGGIFFMNPDGTNRRLFLDDVEQQLSEMDWSPDGKFLVYRESPGRLKIADVSTGAEVRDLGIAGHPAEAQWSPTGEWIAYAHPVDGLTLLSPDGLRRRTFRRRLGYASWSPDGKKLALDAFVRTPDGAEVRTIHILDLTTGELRLVAEPAPPEAEP